MPKWLIIFSLVFWVEGAWSQPQLMLEMGGLWQHRNDVQITPEQGTLVKFDRFGRGPFFHSRLELRHQLKGLGSGRHGYRAVVAPLNLRVTGQSSEVVNFNGRDFNANQDFTVSYKFNSYRLSYFYSAIVSEVQQLDLGLTLKLREAEIAFRQLGVEPSIYDNLGFVPLLYLNHQWFFAESWALHTNFDFAAAPQGRALDLAMKIRRSLSEPWTLAAGVRTLEGGADNNKVLTFSWINYAVMDLTYQF